MKIVKRYEVRLETAPGLMNKNFSRKGKIFPRAKALSLVKRLKSRGHDVYLSSPLEIRI